MGRGRGKGKKMTASSHDDTGSGEDEKIPMQKRRGRPQKPLKDEVDEEDAEKMEEEDGESGKTSLSSGKEVKSPSGAENENKRKRNSQGKEKIDSGMDENGSGARLGKDISVKSNGFRHSRSRRKSTPRRAAEAGVV